VLRVGLTGGIATGKSHVMARLAESGLHTLDLDRIGHEVMAPGGAAYDDVVAAFGPTVLGPDGRVDRQVLGARVFADGAARARLNALVHPRVRAEEARRVAALADDPAAVVVTEAALLVEAGVHLRFDRLVVVHCRPEQQLARLRRRDGLDEAAARARIASQMPIDEKLAFAHLTIDSSGPPEDTDRASLALAAGLRELARARPPASRPSASQAIGCLLHGPRRGPRGLAPARLLALAATDDGPELERLARVLVPPATGAWFRAALDGAPSPGPETLAGPLVLYALARRAPDAEYVAAAAASLARLTHADPAQIARACIAALLLLEVGRSGLGPELPSRLPEWTARARRWSGGSEQAAALDPVVRCALAHPRDAAAASAACGGLAPEPELAGAVVGLAAGADAAAAPPELQAVVRTLLG
jgi:dephospho-CoA kinase